MTFLAKPPDAFGQVAEMKNRLALEKVYLQEEVREEYNHDEIVGHSKAIKDHPRCHRMRD